MNCKNHSDKPAVYHCVNCQGYFCEPCTSVRKVSDDFTAYVCKECGGRAEPIVDKSAAKKSPVKKPVEAKPTQLKETVSKEEKVINASRPKERAGEIFNFWLSLPGALIFPLKGRGILVLVGAAALFFGVSQLGSLSGSLGSFAGALNLPLRIVLVTFISVYLFKAAEDSYHGSAALQKFPDGNYWAQMGGVSIAFLCAVILYLLPAHVYFIQKTIFDPIYGVLLAIGLFLFPMAVVRIAISRKIVAVNPLGVVVSVFKTFFTYIMMCVLLVGLIGLACYLNSEFLIDYDIWGEGLRWLLLVYVSVIGARLTGIFARSYGERISIKRKADMPS